MEAPDLVAKIAKNLISQATPLYEILAERPLETDAELEFGDVLLDLHRMADEPAEWLSFHRDMAPTALIENAFAVRSMMASEARRSRKPASNG